jgi:2-polyprenyl-6-methoxyphenol hydroxylase-like FAD-dependent oxidoreductase
MASCFSGRRFADAERRRKGACLAKVKTAEQDLFDVGIIGAGPAGATAAILLGAKGHRVALLEKEKFPRAVPCAGWVSAKVRPILADLDPGLEALLDHPFSEVNFYNNEFSKKAKPRFKEPAGYIIDRTQFDNTLAKAAVKSGAVFMQQSAVKDLRLGESYVELTLGDGAKLKTRLLLVAAGRNTELLDRVGFARRIGESPIWSAQVDGPIPADSLADPCVFVVLGLDGGNSFGLCTVLRRRLIMNVNWRGDQDQARAQLARMCRLAHEKNVVPIDLSARAAAAPVLRSPAAAALDMDTHVAKHTLLIQPPPGNWAPPGVSFPRPEPRDLPRPCGPPAGPRTRPTPPSRAPTRRMS